MIISICYDRRHYGYCTDCGTQWSGSDLRSTDMCPHCGMTRTPIVPVKPLDADCKMPYTYSVYTTNINKVNGLAAEVQMKQFTTKFSVDESTKKGVFSPINITNKSLFMDLEHDVLSASKNGKQCAVTDSLLRNFAKQMNLRSFPKDTVFYAWGNMQSNYVSNFNWLKELLKKKRVIVALYKAGDHDLVFMQMDTPDEMINFYGNDVSSIFHVSPELFSFILEWWPHLKNLTLKYHTLCAAQKKISDDKIIKALMELIMCTRSSKNSINPLPQLMRIIALKPELDVVAVMRYAHQQLNTPDYNDTGSVLYDFWHILAADKEKPAGNKIFCGDYCFPKNLKLEYFLFNSDIKEEAVQSFIKNTTKPGYCCYSFEDDTYAIEPIKSIDDLWRAHKSIPYTSLWDVIGQEQIRYHILVNKKLSSFPVAVVATYDQDGETHATYYTVHAAPWFYQSEEINLSMNQLEFLNKWKDHFNIHNLTH